jgi:hypothetical protein
MAAIMRSWSDMAGGADEAREGASSLVLLRALGEDMVMGAVVKD